MNILIREMQGSDAPGIALLSGQLGYLLSVEETRMQVEQVRLMQDHKALVALNGETIVGWIHAFKAIRIESSPFIEIGGLVVDESYRGKGIGKLLVQQIMQWCNQEGSNSLRVRSQTKRREAHRFYLQIGFRETKEQKVFEMNPYSFSKPDQR